MKRNSILIIMAILMGALLIVPVQSNFAADLSGEAVEKILQDALDEEYLAYGTYQAILDAHGDIRPFNRIVLSEKRHMKAVERVAERLGVTLTAPTGSFRAPETIEGSYELGVAVEEEDIALMDELLKEDLPKEVVILLSNLKKGSENHLKALTRAQDGNLQTGSGMRAGRGIKARVKKHVDEDGDGLCDLSGEPIGTMQRQGRKKQGADFQECREWVDEDSDGICDNLGTRKNFGRRNCGN